MKVPTTISKTAPATPAMDYGLLRAEGLKHIERMGSTLWTDYNAHDPGITILEILCYAITDLAYRTGAPIENLLSSPTNNAENFRQQFFSAKEILTSRPVTEIDYRKLFIDIDGIKNAWLFRHNETLFLDCREGALAGLPPGHPQFRSFALNGLYDVRIEMDELPEEDCDGEDMTDEEKAALAARRQEAITKVREIFHRHRNLCEDLADVAIVDEHKVCVCMDMEVKPDANAPEIYTEILYRISQYLSPVVRQYGLNEVLALKKEDGSSYPMDEVFNGPVLQHGFILDEDVIASGLRTVVYTSDILNAIMDIPGVVAVKNFVMSACDEEDPIRHEWCLPVPAGRKPVLCTCKSAIHFFKDVIPVKAGRSEAFAKLRERLQKEKEAALSVRHDDYVYPTGAYPDTEDYTSVVHHLPQNYGVSNDGLPLTATAERHTLALQLKGYLLFFDQVLANYLSQLNRVKDLFRLRGEAVTPVTPQTYFFQKVKGIRDIESLFADYDDLDSPGNVLSQLVKGYDNAVDRKNRFLDHLLSRFAENFNEYVLQLYSLGGQKAYEEVILNKVRFLQDYPLTSAHRAAGFDYFNAVTERGEAIPTWDTDNVNGMERRLSGLLGIANFKRQNLSSLRSGVVSDTDSGGNTVFSFLVLDADNSSLLLRSTTIYPTQPEAEAAFAQAVERGADRNEYVTSEIAAGSFVFLLRDAGGNSLAQSTGSFPSAEAAQQAIAHLQQVILMHYLDEGMFVVEHILLRQDLRFLQETGGSNTRENFIPVCADGDCEDGCEEDPYSFRISVILPVESVRFRNFDFRTYIEKVVRLETPAHVYPRVCWWSREDLRAFEELYRVWLENKRNGDVNTEAGLQNLRDLIRILFERKSLYPTGRLDDCEAPVDNPVIINRTALGNLKTG